MYTIHLLVHGNNRESVVRRTEQLFESIRPTLTARWAWLNECPPGAWICLFVTDALLPLCQSKRLEAAASRMSGPRLWVLSWDPRSSLGPLIGYSQVTQAFDLPLDRDRLSARLLGLQAVPLDSPLIWSLKADLPGALTLAPRHLLRSALEASYKDPPPRTTIELARRIGCSRSALSRAASRVNVGLKDATSASLLSWLHRVGQDRSLKELAEVLGYSDSDSLSRWLRGQVGVGWRKFLQSTPSRHWTRLRRVIRPLLEE